MIDILLIPLFFVAFSGTLILSVRLYNLAIKALA